MKLKLWLGAAACALAFLAADAASAQLAPLVNDAQVAPVSVSTITTAKLITGQPGKKTYVTYAFVWANGSVNAQFKYGTGVNCATGTVNLGGPIGMTAQAAFAAGNGAGTVLTLPAGVDFCMTLDAAVQVSGWLMQAQY